MITRDESRKIKVRKAADRLGAKDSREESSLQKEKSVIMPHEVKRRVLDLRRRLNTVMEELDALCDLITE